MTAVPMVNVNLGACRCGSTHPAWGRQPHTSWCNGKPVLIPCPLPRSVTLQVALGECTCPTGGRPPEGHWRYCPARPVKVSCSISGKTWEESEVDDVEFPDAIETDPAGGPARVALEAACRARWALVKALVLGLYPTCGNEDVPQEIFEQRDTVFAALAEMAKAEAALAVAWEACPKALQKRAHPGSLRNEQRPSRWMLAAYVEHLVEQVGVMP